MVVMVMLYYQQSSLVYGAYVPGAEDGKDVGITEEVKITEGEGPTGETGSADVEEYGESTEEESGAETVGDAESGETSTDDWDVEEDPESEEDRSGDDSEDDPPKEEPVEPFQITVPQPDGENGYYSTRPEITITHVSKRGITKYCFTDAKGKITEGLLKECDDVADIDRGKFLEGTNRLSVWMEDEEGNRMEETLLEKVFLIDTEAPVIQIQSPMGLEAWYQKEVFISVSAKEGDYGSGVSQISCYQGGQPVGISSQEKAGFIINAVSVRGSAVPVTVKAVDRAGNSAETSFGLYIDGTAPRTFLDGVEDYMITSHPVTVNYRAEEENLLGNVSASIRREDPEGQTSVIAVEEWKETEKGVQAQQILSEDGLYQIEIEASDRAGQTSGNRAQVMIDSTNPVISRVDQLDGQYMQEFCWEAPAEEWIHDFTSYTYVISLDGRPYHIGESVSREGGHTLEVQAVDAAENAGVARADFVIDHTAPVVIFQGIEEGGQYEEEVEFQVHLNNQEDKIEEIRINGVRQELHSGALNDRYRLQECRNYEIQVKASDKAGNRTTTRLSFRVVEKETVLQRITRPLVDKITGKAKEEQRGQTDSNRQEEAETRKEAPALSAVMGIVIAAAVAIGSMAFVISRYRKKRKLR